MKIENRESFTSNIRIVLYSIGTLCTLIISLFILTPQKKSMKDSDGAVIFLIVNLEEGDSLLALPVIIVQSAIMTYAKIVIWNTKM